MRSDASRPAHKLCVSLSTIGTFHTFDMARQLEKAGALASVHTGYPLFKLRASGIPRHKIHSFPWMRGPYMAGWVPQIWRCEWEHWTASTFRAYVASTLPDCDLYCGLSGSGLQAGRLAQRRGAKYVCDRGSAHIRFQDTILREEFDRWSIPYGGIDPRVVHQEELEYAQADAILVPSKFAQRTFIEQGVSPSKLRLAPYGVDLTRFASSGKPRAHGFDCLFVGALSIEKGAGYLFDAFEKIDHSSKSLTIAGKVASHIRPMLRRAMRRNSAIHVTGHVPQEDLKNLMSRAHVLVLSSVQDGFGLVQAQAMACACPVVASSNTGAEDLFEHGKEGLIVPPRDADALAAAMQSLADDAELRATMARAALQRVRNLGGWDNYGQVVLRAFRDLVGQKSSHRPECSLLLAPCDLNNSKTMQRNDQQGKRL